MLIDGYDIQGTFKDGTIAFRSYIDNMKEGGCYYLSPEKCKDIIITAEAFGVHTPKAVKKLRSKINGKEGVMGDIIPALRSLDHAVVSYYSGELAESLVNAAGNGKGVEIAIGYPKVLVISVN